VTVRAFCPHCEGPVVLWQDDQDRAWFYCPNCSYEVHVSDLWYLYASPEGDSPKQQS
jgi:hypothetical protein